jgi:hypothetical protein
MALWRSDKRIHSPLVYPIAVAWMENSEDRPIRGVETQVTDLAAPSGVHGGESRRGSD